jgi:hypothetical protein
VCTFRARRTIDWRRGETLAARRLAEREAAMAETLTMPQFSLRSLLAIVAVASVGFAGLTHPTRAFNFILVSLALAIVGLFTMHAISSRSTARTFSIGFAIAGWTYLLLLCNDVEYSLLTTWALEELYPVLNPEHDSNMTHYGIFFVGDNGFPLLTKFSNYLHIGHAIWMLAIAYAGGVAARVFARKTSEDEAAPP